MSNSIRNIADKRRTIDIYSDKVHNACYDRTLVVRNGRVVEARVYRRPAPIVQIPKEKDYSTLKVIAVILGFVLLCVFASWVDSL